MLARLERFLLVKTSERHDLYYFLLVFLLMGAGMALGRASTNALFFSRYGIDHLPVLYMVLAGVMALVSIGYAAISDAIPSERFFLLLLIILAIVLVGNWALIAYTDLPLAYPLYLIVFEIASELMMVHAALYLGQNFDPLQTKRLAPLVLAGIQIGTVSGGLFVAGIVNLVGVENILLMWVGLLGVSFALIRARHTRRGSSPLFRAPPKTRRHFAQAVNQLAAGFRFVRTSTLLGWILFSFFWLVVIVYVLTYTVNLVYAAAFPVEEDLTRFFGLLTAATSLTAMLLQILVTGRLLRSWGVKSVNLIFPFAALLAFAGLGLLFALPLAILASFAKDALNPAFRHPAANLLYSALPGHMQGRARALNVALVLPLGLACSGFALIVLQSVTNHLTIVAFGLFASVLFLWANVHANRAYVSQMLATLREKVGLTSGPHFNTDPQDALDSLRTYLNDTNGDIVIACTRMIAETFPQQAAFIVVPHLRNHPSNLRDQVINQLVKAQVPRLEEALAGHADDDGDGHWRATVMRVLIERRHPRGLAMLPELFESENPRLRSLAVCSVSRLGLNNYYELARKARDAMLDSDDHGVSLAGLEALEQLPDAGRTDKLLTLLSSSESRIKMTSLRVLAHWPFTLPEYASTQLATVFHDGDCVIRCLCVDCYVTLPKPLASALLLEALDDAHLPVRQAAAKRLVEIAVGGSHSLIALVVDNRISPRAQSAMVPALIASGALVSDLKSLARAKAEDAAAARQVADTIAETQVGDIGLELLQLIVIERMHHFVELSLMALERLEAPGTVETVRAAMASRDERAIASAVEALHYLKERKIAASLIFALDPLDRDERGLKSMADVFNWCDRHLDHWLNQCASHCRQSYERGLERAHAV